MIYLDLFIGFLKVGLFSFGGAAYGAIPLIRDVVLHYGWMDEEALVNMIAISESTPGPIMVNLATYVGCNKAGVPGGIIATLAVVAPAFISNWRLNSWEEEDLNSCVTVRFWAESPMTGTIIRKRASNPTYQT